MRWRKAEIVSKREIKICFCYIVKDGDVLLPGDEAGWVRGGLRDHPGPIRQSAMRTVIMWPSAVLSLVTCLPGISHSWRAEFRSPPEPSRPPGIVLNNIDIDLNHIHNIGDKAPTIRRSFSIQTWYMIYDISSLASS